jgi:arylsulfate sulfotransferase
MWRRDRLILGSVVFLAAVLSACGSGPAPFTSHTSVTASKNPLVAEYQVQELGPGPASVWVEFGTDYSYGRRTSAVTVPDGASGPVTVVVAGMKADTTYHMRAHVDIPMGNSWIDVDQPFTTGSLPAGKSLTLTVTRPPNTNVSQTGVELLDVLPSGPNNFQAAVADLDGNIIWYYDIGDQLPDPIKQMPNGHMIMNAGVFDLREVDLAGNVVREMTVESLNQKLTAAGYTTVFSLHHDICLLPNGHMVVLANSHKTFTDLPGYPGDIEVLGDFLIDLDTTWNPVWMWSTFDHLDVNRHLMGLPDWTHSNAVIYSPSDGNLLLSMRHQSWVIKIDYANGSGTGNILWRLGNEGDFSIRGGDPAQWFYAEHYPHLEGQDGPQFELSIFDNGNLRDDDVGDPCEGMYPNCYSRAILVHVDEAAKTAAVEWQYRPGFFSSWGGSIGILDNGDVEFDMSAPFGITAHSRVLEVTQTDTPQVVWQLDITEGNAYRAYRLPSLYPGVIWER